MSFSHFLYLILIFIFTESSDKPIFVMTHFRHGARAPQNFWDQNNYLDYIKEHWDNPGELTGIGQRMHYLLGIRNRMRYIDNQGFLSKKFNPHEILIYSSPFNRTIVSVSSQLQGLYPQFIKEGEKLTEEQECKAFPQVDVNNSLINREIENLNLSSLPNSMILAPIRMINNNERKITLYDIQPCTDVRDEIKRKHSESLDTLKNITNFFNEKYADILDNFYNKKEKEKYDLWFIDNFCDAFISGHTERKKMEEFNKTKIDHNELVEFCYEFLKLNFRDWISGDDKHVLAHLEVSKLMTEFIHYMKERINADINGENIDDKFEDYSRPKMMMISGHDSTLSCFEMFLMEALGFDKSFYIYPRFASQLAFEVTRNEDKIGKNYNDYFVNYYFNDELKFNITVEEFINKIKPHIWTNKQINDFCGFENDNDGNNDDGNNWTKAILIIFICLTLICCLIIAILILKLSKLRQLNSKEYNSSLVPRQSE